MSTVLREDIQQSLDEAIAEAQKHSELAQLSQALTRARRDLDQPMRVAIVGKIKAGKSTLMNALLGEDIVATGSSEMTFNVNWFQYAEERGAAIQFRDGRRKVRPFSELHELTIRNSSKGDFLRSIRHIEVSYPNEMLRRFHLIDTPGLDSTYEVDARNTLSFLGIDGDEVEKWTMTAAGEADAIVYLFSKTPSERDLSVMARFHDGVRSMNPVNAIGVLTRVDDYFPQEAEPIRRAGDIIARLQSRHPQLKTAFYLMQPICGLLAIGAQTLTDQEFSILQRIAQVPAILEQQIWSSDNEAFRCSPFSKVTSLPGPAERAVVANRLGFYGCKAAVDLIVRGKDVAEIRRALLDLSGVNRLRSIIVSHFGNRALMIKCYRHFNYVIDVVGFQADQSVNVNARKAVSRIRSRLSGVRARSQAFHEFQVLQQHYENTLLLSDDDVKWMLEITGEYGPRAHQRLGVPADASIPQMKALAEERMLHFKARSYQALDRSSQEAARILDDSYSSLLEDLETANKLLNPDL